MCNSEEFSDKYSVLLLDGLRKASERTGLECRPMVDFCVESLLEFMTSNSLNYEELDAALQAYAELRIYNIDLLNQLTDRIKQTASDLSVRQKLRTLVLVTKSGAFFPDLTELFLPDVLERMETLSLEAQENVLQVRSVTLHWTVISIMAHSDRALMGSGPEWVTVYYVEPSYCNLCGNLNGTVNLVNGLPSHSAPYLVNLWGELTVISMSDPSPV